MWNAAFSNAISKYLFTKFLYCRICIRLPLHSITHSVYYLGLATDTAVYFKSQNSGVWFEYFVIVKETSSSKGSLEDIKYYVDF